MLKSRYYAWLIPYTEGTLDSHRRLLLEKRMAADPQLAAEAEALRRVASHLRRSAAADPPAVVPRSVWPRVEGRLQKRGPAPLVSPRLAWGGAAAIAIGFAFASSQHSDLQDDYLSSPQIASANRSGPEPPVLAAMGKGTFDSTSDPFRPMAVNAPVSAVASSEKISAEKISTPHFAVRVDAGRLAPPSKFTGRLAGPRTPIVTQSARVLVSPPREGVTASAAIAPSIVLPKVSPISPSAANSAATIAASFAASAPITTEKIAPSAAGSTLIALSPPSNPRMAFGELSSNVLHPAPISSLDAIGVAGMNRFFRLLPKAARAASRPVNSLAPILPRSLTAAQSVEMLRAEARGQQQRGHFDGALDTWRDAVFVSLTAPTYADEHAVKQAMETLAFIREAGQLQDLRERLEHQEEFAPDDIVSLRALGYLYILSADVEQARGVWRQVAQSGQASGEDWYQLAGTEVIDGDTAVARSAYENAVRPGALPIGSADRVAAQRWLSDPAH